MAKHLCADCRVRDSALCSSLSDVEIRDLNAISRIIHLPAGATLMWAGDDGIICGNIVSGTLQLTASTGDGREQTVGLLHAADFVGRPQPGETPFSVSALVDSRLCVFPRAAFQAVLGDHPALERLLLQRTMASLDDARSRALMLARGTAEEKLAGFLLELADRHADATDAGAPFDLPLSRGQIASLLGLTIETVSRQMSQFRQAGLIALPGRRSVAINDRQGLMQRAMAR